MSNKVRFLVMPLALVLVFALSAGTAMADGKSSPFKDLVLKMFGYSGKVVKKEVNTIGRGIKKGADVVVEEVKDIGSLATGNASKAKDVLVKPVKGAAKAVGETTYGIVNAPIEAGKEITEEDIK
ncbi:MAG: hypothetical protein U9R52_01615 [Candidatus Omnitrophota bacterium]|nr:hypothetical protein [Candidatus Omnitrophota bacterium]